MDSEQIVAIVGWFICGSVVIVFAIGGWKLLMEQLDAAAVLRGLAGYNGEILQYLGGHPDLAPDKIAVRPTDKGLVFSNADRESVTIAYADIVEITLDSNIQHVNTGGGRSIGGAIVGDLIAGPIGAIVGGQRSTQAQTFDESKTILVARYENMQVRLIFEGGQQTYAALAPLLSQRRALPEG